MYCEKCGKLNNDSAQYCVSCGNPLNFAESNQHNATNDFKTANNSANVYQFNQNQNNTNNNANNKMSFDKKKIIGIVTVVLACLCLILPFCTWADVPMADTLYSYLGGSGSISSYSLFSYVFTSVGSTGGGFAIFLFITLILVIAGMVFNLVYVIKFLTKKQGTGFYLAGAVMLLIGTLIFALFISLTSAVSFGTIHMTVVGWFMIIISIANIVLSVVRKKI